MECVSDQTSVFASAIGATDILVFLNMEVATHKRNDKIYITYRLDFITKKLINSIMSFKYKIFIIVDILIFLHVSRRNQVFDILLNKIQTSLSDCAKLAHPHFNFVKKNVNPLQSHSKRS